VVKATPLSKFTVKVPLLLFVMLLIPTPDNPVSPTGPGGPGGPALVETLSGGLEVIKSGVIIFSVATNCVIEVRSTT
jgi:hypothetical protein